MVEIKKLKQQAEGMRLLLVEDEPALRESVAGYLKKIFGSVETAANGAEGLERFEAAQFDIIATDIMMPRMNGLEMAAAIKQRAPEQEIIIISAYSESDYFIDAIGLGVNGYVLKPIDYAQMNGVLMNSVEKLHRLYENIEYKNHLEEMVQSRTSEIVQLEAERIENFEKTLESFVTMIEDRDTYTGGHSQRVAAYSRLIAERMGYTLDECELLYRAGILHDIGKIATPDTVLLKPGSLNTLEYKLIQEHVNVGYELMSKIPMYREMAEIIRYHHERFDGQGYPSGIKGETIPPLARVMIVADAFDAMTTSRIYKARKQCDQAIDELKHFSGSQFHPEVVEAAVEALSGVCVPESASQLPVTELEKERFAYFYRDQVTNAYNSAYLNIILNRNAFEKRYRSINIVSMHNFKRYNELHGWSSGDKLLSDFVDAVHARYPSVLIFRLYGDDFVLVCETPCELPIVSFMEMPLLMNTGISVTGRYIDLDANEVNNLEALGKLM